MGWLHAPMKISDTVTVSRLSDYGIEDLACEMPDADSFIIELWQEVGFNLNVGSGAYPLTWSEIDSFSNRLALPLTQFESSQLMMMSREYCHWLSKAVDKYIDAPYHNDDYDPLIANRLRNERKLKARRAAKADIISPQ